jgi:membrane protein implicated in regulation of membrane protease activity
MLRPDSPPSRPGTTGCIVVPLALFIALMLASAGVAIWPRMAAPGAAILCGGEVIYESHGASYRPGEYTVTRTLYCQTGEGKQAQRAEITFQAAGISFLIYSVVAFLLLQFVARPLLRRRVNRTLEAARTGAPDAAASLGGLLGRVAQAAARGAAARDAPAGEETGDVAERLARLRALRDQGLITASDYDAKKAEILSRL